MAYEATTFDQEAAASTEGLKARAQQAVQSAKARSTETVEDTVDLVRRHPGKAVGISLLIGGVLGALIVNALTEDTDTRWDRLSDLTADAWDAVKERSEDALTIARDALDSAIARFR